MAASQGISSTLTNDTRDHEDTKTRRTRRTRLASQDDCARISLLADTEHVEVHQQARLVASVSAQIAHDLRDDEPGASCSTDLISTTI